MVLSWPFNFITFCTSSFKVTGLKTLRWGVSAALLSPRLSFRRFHPWRLGFSPVKETCGSWYYQLDMAQNQLRIKPLGKCVRQFLDWIKWGGTFLRAVILIWVKRNRPSAGVRPLCLGAAAVPHTPAPMPFPSWRTVSQNHEPRRTLLQWPLLVFGHRGEPSN